MEEVADAIGEDRRTVMKVERIEWKELRRQVFEELGAYCHKQRIEARDIVEFDPDGIRTPGLEGARLSAA